MFVKGKKCLLRENMYIYRMEERVEMWNEKKEGKNISTKMEKKNLHEHKNVIKYIGFCKRSHIVDRGIKKKGKTPLECEKEPKTPRNVKWLVKNRSRMF